MLTQERVRELFEYREDGELIRKIRTGPRTRVGDVAGGLNINGYKHIHVNGKSYKSHRLVWFYHYGYFPENDIDHINRIKTDNRIENLREVSRSCNTKNSCIRADNLSGIAGVGFDTDKRKWRVRIGLLDGRIHLGYFDTFLEAARARHQAEVKHKWANCNTTSSAYLYLKEHDAL